MKEYFPLRDALQHEFPLLMGNDGEGAYGLIASLDGTFGHSGDRPLAVISSRSPIVNTRHFREALDCLIHHLKTNYANGLLMNANTMCNLCAAYGEEQNFIENGHKIIGFETHTDDYQFYIKCVPAQKINNSSFYIHCYERKKLLAAGMIAYEEDA